MYDCIMKSTSLSLLELLLDLFKTLHIHYRLIVDEHVKL